MSETLICIAEDVGIRVWLERILDDEWLLEFVSASDLSRVSRLGPGQQRPGGHCRDRRGRSG